ncbi:very short patch repair endonuclease [Marispirochaeta sp.]|uniref:very short patch repair endonuclease n=1 Tax=Marispirochaeta sp. TaxID=2038653 RepID=UPI0029C71D70|nr:very short patch repair endonuclease [Marispirochaeta sp.]
MTDRFSPQKRSEIMSRISGKDTKNEILVRSFLFRHGYRFRKHKSELPGTPDIYLSKYKIAIFVNGCFWHGHSCKRGQSRPKTNAEKWRLKIEKNVIRDRKTKSMLISLGIHVIEIWECELSSQKKRDQRLGLLLEEINNSVNPLRNG